MVCHPQQMQVVTCWHLQSMTSTLYVLSSGKQRWQIYIFLVSGAVLSSFGASAMAKALQGLCGQGSAPHSFSRSLIPLCCWLGSVQGPFHEALELQQ